MKNNDKVVANIWTSGDMSVGMPGYAVTVTIEGTHFAQDFHKEDREYIRKSLTEVFGEYLDNGKTIVTFSDECCDCGATLIPLKDGKGFRRHKCPMW